MKSNKLTNPIKIILIEDLGLLRKALKEILETKYPFIQVIATAVDGITGVEIAEALDPDVIVCNIGLPVINGIEVTARITRANPDAKVLIFTVHRVEGIEESIEAGAKAYLMKDTSIEGLVLLLRYVYEGGHWLDPALKKYGSYLDDVFLQDKKEAEKYTNNQPEYDESKIKYLPDSVCKQSGYTDIFLQDHAQYLSKFEITIIQLVLCGYDFSTIATLLNVDKTTVKATVYNIMSRLRLLSP